MAPAAAREVTFDERVDAQEAIEAVLDAHRTWPQDNVARRPQLRERLSRQVLEERVGLYLKQSNALDVYFHRPITARQLQAEMDRMVRTTQDPSMLREIFSALHDDPTLIGECLARRLLADRLVHRWHEGGDFDAWWEQASPSLSIRTAPLDSALRLPAIGPVGSDGWTRPDSLGIPEGRRQFVAVWTGTEMIVWGGYGVGQGGDVELDSGGRYDPATDTWTPTSTGPGCPTPRPDPVAIWTGSEMIVWGGSFTNTGGRYDPATDRWTPTSTGASCPSLRHRMAGVWTGREMIIWGGSSTNDNTGGRYDPATDQWRPTSTGVGCPEGRSGHTAVWTGTEMIVWGGELDTGGRYDPARDEWTPTSTGSGCPTGSIHHTAIWTGSEMVVWGGRTPTGYPTRTGGRYDPITDQWSPMNTSGAPGLGFCSGVWTGREMIVWGGSTAISNGSGYGYAAMGARYDPASDSWRAVSTGRGCPAPRGVHQAVWTGREMVVWGGMGSYQGHSRLLTSGGRYDPASDSWVAMAGSPMERKGHTAVWTGSEMILWGGFFDMEAARIGSRYQPATDSWTWMATGLGCPSARYGHTAIWTGDEMIVWGGARPRVSSGGRYDPWTDTWKKTSSVGAPEARWGHSAVWAGTTMIVWGGSSGTSLASGGRYDPATDGWRPTSLGVGCPASRLRHTSVWTGRRMIVWGGDTYTNVLGSGALYDPLSDRWTATTTGPTGRYLHTAVWTGGEMIVWGGYDTANAPTSSGSRYDPVSDGWTATPAGGGCPAPRYGHSAVWTGTKMIVWGGHSGLPGKTLNTGGRYDLTAGSWMATSTAPSCPRGRAGHTAIWTGDRMIVCGGDPESNEGGIYTP